MKSYNNFAYIYDSLMKPDVDYEQYADYIENLFYFYDKNPNLAADLACGTGNLTIPLSNRGYDMTGVDISEDMLTAAREKDSAGNILWLCQDLAQIDLFGTMDAFICGIDGINYITIPKNLEHFFRRLHDFFINPDGIFIFDISSRSKLEHTLADNTFIYSTDQIFYSWQNRMIKNHLCDMYLNFFVKNEDGSYKRFEERHLQRAWSRDELVWLLKKCGFSRVDTYSFMSFNPASDSDERIVFAALP